MENKENKMTNKNEEREREDFPLFRLRQPFFFLALHFPAELLYLLKKYSKDICNTQATVILNRKSGMKL